MSSRPAVVGREHPPRALTLWVDGCGGFRLLTGSRWSVGGAIVGNTMSGAAMAGMTSDVAVQTDWPRCAGWLQRDRGEYFWRVDGKDPQWLRQDALVPVPGEVKLRLQRPSPLSQSASLRLESSHRFATHVDAVVLVQDTVLIGPGTDCHVRCRGLGERWVLVEKDGQWRMKVGQRSAESLNFGQRFIADSLSLTLETS